MGLAMEKQIITGSQWIAHCDPTKSITELLIPGTHDTMTADCEARYYRTQTLSLQQQLQIGVRFWIFACVKRWLPHTGNGLVTSVRSKSLKSAVVFCNKIRRNSF